VALRPDADVTVNGWRNESGGTTLYASLNETSANDATYIQSASNPSASDYFEVGLSNPSGTPTNGPFKYRIFKKLNNAAVVNMKVALMQGATEIASWLHSDISNTPTEYSQTLTGPQFSAITDFTDLRIRGIPNPVVAVAFTAGSTSVLEIGVTGVGTTHTHLGISFPNPATGRVCGVCIIPNGTPILTCTIGGTGSAKQAGTYDGTDSSGSGSSNNRAYIWTCGKDTGTSHDVVLTHSNFGINSCIVHSFVLNGASSATCSSNDAESWDGVSAASPTLIISAGGVGVWCGYANYNAAPGITWDNGNPEDLEGYTASSHAGSMAHLTTPGFQTLTANSPGFSAACAAAWAP
jgi:hypothetical protein